MYFGIVYIFPIIGNWWLGDSIISSYAIYPLTPTAVATLAATYILFRIFVRVAPRAPRPVGITLDSHIKRLHAWYRHYRILVGLIAVLLAIANLSAGLTSFRYAQEGIASRESALLPMMMVLYAIASADLFYFMFVRDRDAPQGARRRFEHLMLALSLVIAANGIAMLLLSLCTLAYAMSPKTFHQAAFVQGGPALASNLKRILIAVPVFCLVFVVAWYAGNVIKLSSSDSMESLWADPTRVASVAFTHDSVAESLAAYAVERPSVFYYAFLYTENVPWIDLGNGTWSAIVFPLQTMLYRLNLITGRSFDIERPTVTSIMQLNYLLTTHGTTTERGGTSPGLIAAFTYVLPRPLNILACVAYLWWLCMALGDLVGRNQERLSLLGEVLALQFLVGFFSSPFDWLILVDNEVLYLALLLLLLTEKRRQLSIGVSSAVEVDAPPVLERENRRMTAPILSFFGPSSAAHKPARCPVR